MRRVIFFSLSLGPSTRVEDGGLYRQTVRSLLEPQAVSCGVLSAVSSLLVRGQPWPTSSRFWASKNNNKKKTGRKRPVGARGVHFLARRWPLSVGRARRLRGWRGRPSRLPVLEQQERSGSVHDRLQQPEHASSDVLAVESTEHSRPSFVVA